MIELSLDDKRTLILEYEKSRARELARLVIEKPVPPVWMIFIPVFFIFYAWKIREYSSGLKDFSKHYLVSRNRALDIAYEAEKTGKLEEIDDLAENNYPIPSHARPAYRRWLSLLVDHYRNLLTAGSSSVEGLIRAHYRNKATFMLTNNQLRTAEAAFNSALLPKIEGDSQDIRYVFEKMERSLTDLYRREVDDVFP
jgi:hypothetical protein